MPRSLESRQVQELRNLTQRLFRRFGALAAEGTPCGKPISIAHAHALMILRSRGELTQQQLAAELCIDKSNIARLCAKLVESGQVKQRPAEKDARSRKVCLTPRGEKLATEVDEASMLRFTRLLTALPEAERGHVLGAMGLLLAAVETLPAADLAERSVA
jgi:DNA-binding MarR family transcriptional regulator